MSRVDALRIIEQRCADLPVITTCGATSREYRLIVNRPGHLPVVDSMGLGPSIATGLAMALADSPKAKVVAVEGDGGMLMNINSLATAAVLKPGKLLIVVLDNRCYASTGGQRTLSRELDLAQVARGFGLKALQVESPADLDQALADALASNEPIFLHVRIAPGNAKAPYLLDDPALMAYRFQRFCLGQEA